MLGAHLHLPGTVTKLFQNDYHTPVCNKLLLNWRHKSNNQNCCNLLTQSNTKSVISDHQIGYNSLYCSYNKFTQRCIWSQITTFGGSIFITGFQVLKSGRNGFQTTCISFTCGSVDTRPIFFFSLPVTATFSVRKTAKFYTAQLASTWTCISQPN